MISKMADLHHIGLIDVSVLKQVKLCQMLCDVSFYCSVSNYEWSLYSIQKWWRCIKDHIKVDFCYHGNKNVISMTRISSYLLNIFTSTGRQFVNSLTNWLTWIYDLFNATKWCYVRFRCRWGFSLCLFPPFCILNCLLIKSINQEHLLAGNYLNNLHILR